MNYSPTEKELQKWGKDIFNSFAGFTKDDIEPLFERFIIPIYIFASRRLNEDGKWKLINRETGKEFSVDEAIEATKKLYQIYS